ncbi:MAG TPA: PEGA domain-containing protein [Candidatus Methanoperedenaceae archaeon]|nr:PEGA domain-containing protein [Candidatus Methanoperedenaceae archaeon]
MLAMVVMLSGCVTIDSVNQPSTATPGGSVDTSIKISLAYNTSGSYVSPALAVKIPNDWGVTSAYYTGTGGASGMSGYLTVNTSASNDIEAKNPSGGNYVWIGLSGAPRKVDITPAGGTVTVYLRVGTTRGNYKLNYSAGYYSGSWYWTDFDERPISVNTAPQAPGTPSGPATGATKTSYSYSATSTDPDGDSITYTFDWGDGTSGITGSVSSGSKGTTSKTWSSPGTYQVKAKAADSMGASSGWSPSLTVTISMPAGISVTSSQPGTEVYVDGILKGTAPNFVSDVTAGTHAVLCKKAGYDDFKKNVDVTGSGSVSVLCEMVKAGETPSGSNATVTAAASPTVTQTVTNGDKGPGIDYGTLGAAALVILIIAGILAYLWLKSDLRIIPKASSLAGDGVSTLPIKVQFANAFGRARTSGKNREVEIETTSGKIQKVVIPAGKEFAEAVLTSSTECGPVVITAKSGKQKASAKINFTCTEAGLSVEILPAEIPADGKSTAAVTVRIKDDAGRHITPLTERSINLTTTLGSVSTPAKIQPKSPSGTATLTSGTASGIATVKATMGAISGEGSATIGELARRFCMHCGATMSMEAHGCAKCGKTPPSDVDTKQCGTCGVVLPKIAKFCDKCGARQAAQ